MKIETCYILAISVDCKANSVALLKDRQLIFSEEEKTVGLDLTGSFPNSALCNCFESQQINFEDIDFIIIFNGLDASCRRSVVIYDQNDTLYSIKGIFLCDINHMDQEAGIQSMIKKTLGLNLLTEIPPLFYTDKYGIHHYSRTVKKDGYTEASESAYLFWQNYIDRNEKKDCLE